jgi:hypothetical protein
MTLTGMADGVHLLCCLYSLLLLRFRFRLFLFHFHQKPKALSRLKKKKTYTRQDTSKKVEQHAARRPRHVYYLAIVVVIELSSALPVLPIDLSLTFTTTRKENVTHAFVCVIKETSQQF